MFGPSPKRKRKATTRSCSSTNAVKPPNAPPPTFSPSRIARFTRRPEDLYSADEVFISSTNRNIIGVGEIAGHKIAAAPGPITRQIEDLFVAHVTDYVTRRLAATSR